MMGEDGDDEDDNAEDEVEDEKVNDNAVEKKEDDVEEEDRSQDWDPHLARACAIEMHVDVSQEPLYTEICRKTAAAQIEPRMRANLLGELAQSKRTSRYHRSNFKRKFAGQMLPPSWIPQAGPALFTGKMPRPRLSP